MTPALRYPFSPRGAARYLQAVHSLVAQYGGDCWPLDDAPGSAVARSLTGQNDGAVSATGVTFGQQGPLCAGQYAGAAGITYGGGITAAQDLNLGSGAFTITTWCKIDDVLVNFPAIVSRFEGDARNSGASSNKGIFLGVGFSTSAKSRMRFVLDDGTAGASTNINYYPAASILGAWQNVVAVADSAGAGALLKLYHDGVLSEQATRSRPGSIDVAQPYSIGRWPLLNRSIQGQMAFPAIIPAALSAEEIRTLYLTATQGD